MNIKSNNLIKLVMFVAICLFLYGGYNLYENRQIEKFITQYNKSATLSKSLIVELEEQRKGLQEISDGYQDLLSNIEPLEEQYDYLMRRIEKLKKMKGVNTTEDALAKLPKADIEFLEHFFEKQKQYEADAEQYMDKFLNANNKIIEIHKKVNNSNNEMFIYGCDNLVRKERIQICKDYYISDIKMLDYIIEKSKNQAFEDEETINKRTAITEQLIKETDKKFIKFNEMLESIGIVKKN